MKNTEGGGFKGLPLAMTFLCGEEDHQDTQRERVENTSGYFVKTILQWIFLVGAL